MTTTAVPTTQHETAGTNSSNLPVSGAARSAIPLLMYVLAGLTPAELQASVLTAPIHVAGRVDAAVAGLDTMAAVNVISEATLSTVFPTPLRQTSTVVLRGLHGPTPSRGYVNIAIRFPGFAMETVRFEVVAALPPPLSVIMSYTWLRQHAAIISLSEKDRKVELTIPSMPPATTQAVQAAAATSESAMRT